MESNKHNKLVRKHVLVVGGTSGIGYAVTEAAIENGVRVTASLSRDESIKTTLDRLSGSYPGAQIAGYACGLSKSSVEADAEALFRQVGTVDHIVYTAGDRLATITSPQVSMENFVQASQLRFFALFFVARVGSRYLSPGPMPSITIEGGSIAERPVSNRPCSDRQTGNGPVARPGASQETYPAGHLGQAEDVAEAYLWLMKDKNVTGRVVGSDSSHSLA